MTPAPPPDPLAALRANYAKKLPDKVAEIAAALAALDGAGGSDAVQGLRNLVHKMAGSAPTFGFSELGDAARAAERACDAVLSAGTATAPDVVRIRDAVARMAALAGAGASERAAGAPAAPVGAATLSGRVLVVEDEPSQALFAQVVLRKVGLDVTIESDPTRVADRLAEIDPALVFLDMNMPKMDGDAVAAQIRGRTDAWASVPIVFLSGEEDPVRRDAAMAAGATGFVAKPVNPAALIDAARRYLGK